MLMSYQEFETLALPFYAGKIAERISKTEIVNQEITQAQLQDLREEVIAEMPDPEARLAIEPELRIEPLDWPH